jgi:hypothetical protein
MNGVGVEIPADKAHEERRGEWPARWLCALLHHDLRIHGFGLRVGLECLRCGARLRP